MEAKKNIIHPKYKIKKRPKKEPNAHTKKNNLLALDFLLGNAKKKSKSTKKSNSKRIWPIE